MRPEDKHPLIYAFFRGCVAGAVLGMAVLVIGIAWQVIK